MLKIDINNQRRIFAIQREFSGVYPDVSIEFYEKSNTNGGAPSKKLMRSRNKSLSECRTVPEAGIITIQDGMTINELKHTFSDVYGLSIDLFKYNTHDNKEDRKPIEDNVLLSDLNQFKV